MGVLYVVVAIQFLAIVGLVLKGSKTEINIKFPEEGLKIKHENPMYEVNEGTLKDLKEDEMVTMKNNGELPPAIGDVIAAVNEYMGVK